MALAQTVLSFENVTERYAAHLSHKSISFFGRDFATENNVNFRLILKASNIWLKRKWF